MTENKITINYTVQPAGFPAVCNHKISELSDDQLAQVAKLIRTYAVVVFEDQRLSADEEVDVCKRMGVCSNVRNFLKSGGTREEQIVNDFVLKVGNSSPYDYVTKWHVDACKHPSRLPMHWLYAVTDSEFSRTSWINTAKVYESLSSDVKEWVRDKKFGFLDPTTSVEFDIVYKNTEGVLGLYYPFLQDIKIIDESEETIQRMHNDIVNAMLKEENIYHHYWRDGDLVISDQWHSMHSRKIFDYDTNRVMHRIAFDTRCTDRIRAEK
jgi:alpha-ketoglutarate-dependent taurine dioxygenase